MASDVLPAQHDIDIPGPEPTTAGDMNFYLQSLLDRKEKQLQQAGNLGQRVLAQQMELEERIRQLQEHVGDKADEDEVDNPEAKARYQELSETILTWDAENAQLSAAFGASSKRQPSPSPAFAELPLEVPEHKRPQGSAAGQSRRAKNAANRSFIDPEFAMDIGNNLLAEIRRLQSLLTERDKAIQDMKEERDDLEKTVEALKATLKQQERSSDKYKEENWNLEVSLQELRSQLTDSQSSVVRLESELKKQTRLLNTSRDSLDQYKTESERSVTQLVDLKSKHESDIAQARKHAAGLARDKSDLQTTVDQLKTELTRANRRLPKFGSPLTPGTTPGGADVKDFITPAGTDAGTDLDPFTGGASTNRRKYDISGMFPDDFAAEGETESPEGSPLRRPFLAPNHPNNEIEALQQRLVHAQRQINTLKGSLNREKMLRIKLEQAAGSNSANGGGEDDFEGIDGEEDNLDDDIEMVSESTEGSGRTRSRRGGTPFRAGALSSRGTGRRGGRGRGGGITLIQRLGMAAHSPASHYSDDDQELDGGSRSRETSPPPIPPITFHAAPDADEEEEQFFNSSSTSLAQNESGTSSNRTSVASVEGMDPAFANILKRAPSNSSNYGSPLRHSLLSRRGSRTNRRGLVVGRKSRGGVPFKEGGVRPPSLINDKPSALAAELGLTSPTKSEFGSGAEESIREEEEDQRAWRKEVVGDEEEEMLDEMDDVEFDGVVNGEEVEEVEMKDFGCQTEPVEVEKAEVQMQTELSSSVFNPIASQASLSSTIKAKTYPEGLRRTTITQADLSLSSSMTSSSGDNTITRSFLSRPLSTVSATSSQDDEYDDGEETETGADETGTETETDYYDARGSINMVTPSGISSAFSVSRESFHSIMTVSDHEFPSDSDSDGESVKANRTTSGAVPENGRSSIASYYTDNQAPLVTYVEVGVSADLVKNPEPEVVVQIKEVQVLVEVVKEVVREVPVEVIKEVPVEVEVVKEVRVEVPVEVVKEVEVIKEVPVEVIKYVEVPVEIVKEVVKEVEVPVEVIREVVKEVEKEVPVEVIREVKVEVPVPVTVQKDVPVEVVKEVEVIKEVLVEVPVTREVEVIREVRVEVPVTVTKEVEVEVVREVKVEVPVEVVREVKVPVEVVKEVKVEVVKEVPVQVEVIKEVRVPMEKPESKEMQVQTDVILDEGSSVASFEQSTLMDIPRRHLSTSTVSVQTLPTSLTGPVFIPPNGLPATTNGVSSSLLRVGSTGQSQHQFQFVAPPPPSPISRDGSNAAVPTLLSRASRLSSPDRPQSVESALSSVGGTVGDNNMARPVLLNATDKSKPPMMVLPPPPKAPPPPTSMAPPQFVPDRRGGGIPPPRPSSPPPPELIQRATTPTFGSVLNVPGVNKNSAFGSVRSQTGGTMSPASAGANLHRLPSSSSFQYNGPLGTIGNISVERRQFSTTSLGLSERSPRSSISSSEHAHLQHHASMRSNNTAMPSTPNKTPRAYGQGATDPAVIHSITQTMIGEFMYKYTRKTIGKGHGERRHRRFFWVHPYTKTLYWSSSDPGSSNVNESSAKSAYIEGVRSVLDPNPMPPGLYQYSVIVSTPQREMKITAPTKERHDIWLNALKYLLSRPNPNASAVDDSPALQSPSEYITEDDREHRRQRLLSSPQSFRSSKRGTPGDTWNTTPRGTRSRSQLSVRGSVGKRSGTPALEYLRWNTPAPESPYSPTKSFVDVDGQVDEDEEDLDFELHNESMSDGGFEGLENVRACCDGRHTVGHSGKHPHHHHHHHHALASHPISQLQAHAQAHTAPLMNPRRQSSDNQHLDPNPLELGRPVSPAWSLRSKAGSTHSHDGGGLFSWARGESKLRFGSKRSAKAPVLPSVDQ